MEAYIHYNQSDDKYYIVLTKEALRLTFYINADGKAQKKMFKKESTSFFESSDTSGLFYPYQKGGKVEMFFVMVKFFENPSQAPQKSSFYSSFLKMLRLRKEIGVEDKLNNLSYYLKKLEFEEEVEEKMEEEEFREYNGEKIPSMNTIYSFESPQKKHHDWTLAATKSGLLLRLELELSKDVIKLLYGIAKSTEEGQYVRLSKRIEEPKITDMGWAGQDKNEVFYVLISDTCLITFRVLEDSIKYESQVYLNQDEPSTNICKCLRTSNNKLLIYQKDKISVLGFS